MKDNLPRNILLPFIIGIGFCLFIMLGINSDFISGYSYINIFAIILGAFVLYAGIFGIINNSTNLLLGIGGFQFGRVFLSMLFLLAAFLFERFIWPDEPEYKSLLEKENFVLKPDFKECHKVKYGKFIAGGDTILRFIKDKKDYETIYAIDDVGTYRINWLDSCSYYRVVERSGSVKEVIKLGNFNGPFHDMYIRPAALHYINEEKIIRVFLPGEIH